MQFTKWLIVGASLLLASPVFATTYYGGFEDWNSPSSDYDYNDLVFSVSGSGLTLHSPTGVWFNAPALNTINTSYFSGTPTNGKPFWNNSSWDGAGGYNVGSCIYGGGVCNGGAGLSPAAQYLATQSGGTVNDVYFSLNGAVSEQVSLSISAASDSLGWELASGGPINWLGTGVSGPVTFDPTGDFILVGRNSITSDVFSSNSTANDGYSHFAFFAPTPEPGTIGMFGFALLGGGLAFRKRFARV